MGLSSLGVTTGAARAAGGHGRRDSARTICVLLEVVVAEVHPDDDTGQCGHHPERELST